MKQSKLSVSQYSRVPRKKAVIAKKSSDRNAEYDYCEVRLRALGHLQRNGRNKLRALAQPLTLRQSAARGLKKSLK